MEEFELIESHLDKGAIVLMDNTYAIADKGKDPRVHGALTAIVKRWGGSFTNLEFVSWYTPGLAIWKRDAFTLATL
jgi:predicted SpoU family rRNA methylase